MNKKIDLDVILRKYENEKGKQNRVVRFDKLELQTSFIHPSHYYFDMGYVDDILKCYNELALRLNKQGYGVHMPLSAKYEETGETADTSNIHGGFHVTIPIDVDYINIIFYNTVPGTSFDIFNGAHNECEVVLSMNLGSLLVSNDYVPFLPIPREVVCFTAGFRLLQKRGYTTEEIYKTSRENMIKTDELKTAWDIFSEYYLLLE